MSKVKTIDNELQYRGSDAVRVLTQEMSLGGYRVMRYVERGKGWVRAPSFEQLLADHKARYGSN